jgi:hypothetical protein
MRPLPCLTSYRRLFGWMTLIVAGSLLYFPFCAKGDQVEMQNGDRYSGKVLSYTNNVILLTNDFAGTITLPRTNVSRVLIGTVPSGPAAAPKAESAVVLPKLPTNSLAGVITSLDKSSTADQAAKVKQDLLGDANPAAKAKFDEMLGDITSGKMSLGDLRAQAVSAATQLRQLKKELGPQSDDTLDGYLTVLESFIGQVPADSPVTRTNNAVTPVISKTTEE